MMKNAKQQNAVIIKLAPGATENNDSIPAVKPASFQKPSVESNTSNSKKSKRILNGKLGNERSSSKPSSLYGSNNSLADAPSSNTQKHKVGSANSSNCGIRLKQGSQATASNKPREHPLKSISTLRKVGAKVGAVMRRASSRESLDSNREREKENFAKPVDPAGHLVTKGGSAVAGITIMQLEKDKTAMEHQISELVRNAECKKAEIATLKMEIKRLKEHPSDEEKEGLKLELDTIMAENRSLKDRLLDLGVPLEQTSLSDSEKEQLLLRRSASGSMASLDSERKDICMQCRKSDVQMPEQELDAGEASGSSLLPPNRSLAEWDKASSSSQSEMSVACLQDRILQMEETHYSTNEELQATLQELTDLQDQLTDLQLDNDRMGEDKAVLLESLCSQTEKLEECRSQLTQLKQLLFKQFEDGTERTLVTSERERHYVDLLKNAQEEQDVVLDKQNDLTNTIDAMKEESMALHAEYQGLLDKVQLLESTIDSVNSDKRLLETQLAEAREQISANHIDSSQLRLQLEKEQQKVLELQKECEASATSELETLLLETRQDKEKVAAHSLHLQEQLLLAQRDILKAKEQLSLLQEESKVTKNNAKKQLSDLEYRVEQMSAEKVAVQKETEILSEVLQEAELKCQRHLEDKRELKANVGELQKLLSEKTTQFNEAVKELKETREKLSSDTEEWKRFQADLLTTVRVANDFKTEAQIELERLVIENKQLREKVDDIEKELKLRKDVSSPSHQRSSPLRTSSVSFPVSSSDSQTVLSTVEKELGQTRRPIVPGGKLADFRGASQLSVKSLIESIENATKTVKGQGLSSSRSSSTSSISSLASETRNASSSLILRTAATESVNNMNRENMRGEVKGNSNPSTRLQRSSFSESKSAGESATKSMESLESAKPHPVSILANKLEPIRRNSYGFLDIVEKKDPLASLVKGGGSKRNALLKWCQTKTVGYKGIDITNFSSSWNDGLAFCALLHSYLPDLIPYDELDSKDKSRNFTLAFRAAESVGITTTLQTKDLIWQERPDWQSIMSYVTSIYKHFET